MLNIGIRVDGSANIGMGHIMRCLSLQKDLEMPAPMYIS